MSDKDYEYIRKITYTNKSNIWLCRPRATVQYVLVKELIISEITNSEHVWNEKKILHFLTNSEYKFSPKFIGTHKSESSLYIVMDVIPGAPLQLHMPINFENLKLIFLKIIVILENLHKNQIVYRDVKLSNFILANNEVFICDFGHAKQIRGRTFSECGTLHAMAPEVGNAEGYGMEVEFWSLGILLFELIEGKAPFGYGKRAREYNICFDPARHRDGSDELIRKLVEPDREKRLTDWNEVKRHRFLNNVGVKIQVDERIGNKFIFGDNDLFNDF